MFNRTSTGSGFTPPHSSRLRSNSKTNRERLSQNLTEETLIHWYKSHHSGLLHAINLVNTEESEGEYVVVDDRYEFHCFHSLCNPYAKCYQRVKKIRAYRHYLQDTLETLFRTLRWIDLPGGQNRVAAERNYLMNYIWLMCFIVSEVDTTNKDSARHIRYRLEDLLVQAENLGVILQQYFTPLQTLAQNHSLVEDMGDLLQYRKIPRTRAEKKIFRLNLKPENTMLAGNKVMDFSKLFIYVRKDCQVWTRFKALTDADKVDIVTKGLMEISDSLKDLKRLVKRPLRAIKAGGGGQLSLLACFLPKLVPHVKQMKLEIKNIISKTGNNIEGDDRNILECLLNEVVSHYAYVLRFGEKIVEEIWDIISMVRLSYTYIRESPLNNINAVSPEAVLKSRFRKSKIKRLLKWNNINSEDFFKADCPDTLRKLPVVVYPANAELSLHLQGHRNLYKSRASTPTHKFSIRKRQSILPQNSKPEVQNPTNTTKENNQLMFVSEGD